MPLTSCSIIAEYNPFHNGHLYQLQKAKRESQADVLIAIMSGNWTQRGNPSLFDKWQRTKMALANGVDLVVELPVQFAVQPADLFADGGVQTASALKSDFLAFGCEHSKWDFAKMAHSTLTAKNAEFKDYRVPYAEQLQRVIAEQVGFKVSEPNDVLALSYARSNFKLVNPMNLLPLQRTGGHHNDNHLNAGNISSASSIRRALFMRESVSNFIPEETKEFISGGYRYSWSDFWPLVRYQLLETPLDELRLIYQMNEGIENRLKRAALVESSWDDFLLNVKTKRYSYARIQRLLFYLLIKASPQFKSSQINCLRILGFNSTGQQYLKQIKNTVDLPIISNPTQDNFHDQLKWTVKSGLLFKLVSGQNQDYYRHPVIDKLSRKTP